MNRLFTALVMFLALGLLVSASYAQKLAPESSSLSSYALHANGTLYAWGSNGSGQLGDGTTAQSNTPVAVLFPGGVTRWTAIAIGQAQGLGIGNDGNLYAWGNNNNGQYGNGTTDHSYTPVKISMPSGVTSWVAIAAGGYHDLAIGSDGNLYAWGYNSNGQLGNGNTTDQHSLVMVSLPGGVTRWTAIAGGWNYSLAIGNDGNIYSWGENNYGQLGNGTTTDSDTPVVVTKPGTVTSWTAIAAAAWHSLAIGNDGNIYAWGNGGNGTLGNGTMYPGYHSSTPVEVTKPGTVTSWTTIATAWSNSLAIGNNDTLYAWGQNYGGEGTLGNGTTTDSDTPVVVTMPSGVTKWTAIAGGWLHSLAIGNDGYLYAWGDNEYGELGINSADNNPHPTPVRVLGVGGVGDLALPVEVTGFCAESKAGHAVLIWKTQSEVDMAGFNIYREDPGSSSFNLIASYKTDNNLKSLGTSTSARIYTFIDHKVRAGNTYTYKLQSVSTNSVTKDYDPISVRVRVPESYGLSQNYPNPFNPTTTIGYQLAGDSHVTLRVYDVLGREVATLVNEMKSAGEYTVKFDGSKFASGVYFYRFNAAGVSQVKGMLLSK